MSYTKQDLINDVTSEAISLRRLSTEDEKEKLHFDSLDPGSYYSCIYGQMTGSCKNSRAAYLIESCCTRFFKNGRYFNPESLNGLKKSVNGATVDNFINERMTNFSIVHFSAIETYIMLPNAKNENLINFIKGNTDELKL